MTDDDAIDFRALDTDRHDAAIATLLAAAAPMLAQRRAPRRVLDEIVRWQRPALAAAAAIMVAAGSILLLAREERVALPQMTWAETAGVPTQLADYVEHGQVPRTDQVWTLAGAVQ